MVKQLLLIILCSTGIFMALAIFQEWDIFQPFFAGAASENAQPPLCSERAREAVGQFTSMLVHVYRSGGDVRFLARLPASDQIKEEITSDLQYLARNGRYQAMNLQKLEIVQESYLADDACEIHTREYWILRYLDRDGKELDEIPQAIVTAWRYIVQQTVTGWQVVRMEPWNGA